MAGTEAHPSSTLRTWLVRGTILVVVAALSVVAFRLIGQVDWDAVGRGLSHLSWWQVPVLVVLLLVRQVCNSLPLALYIERVTPYRATINDQVAVLIGTMFPPPSDLALRTAMFSSWGVPVAKGIAGALLHKLTFYIVRYAAPVVGLLILILRGDGLGVRLVDLASIALAIGIAVILVLVMHSTALARTLGRRSGKVVRRVRRTVDPDSWATSWAEFHDRVATRFHRGFARSLVALAAMLAVSCLMAVLCLRFVGVDSGSDGVPTSVIVAAYMIAFPLTLFPFNGIGLLDAAVVGAIVAAGGQHLEAPALAGMIAWRVFTLGGPMLLGVVSLLIWHRTWGADVGLWRLIRSRASH